MELQNLDKENFWDAMYERYPNAVQEFYKWIDEYKNDNNWVQIFGNEIKYHHIPLAMQIGIWIEFNLSFGCGNGTIVLEYGYDDSENLWEWFSEWFHHRQMDLTQFTND